MSSLRDTCILILKDSAPKDWRAWIILLLSSVWVLYTLAYLSNLFFYLGIIPYPTAHRALNVGMITALVFITKPLRKGHPLVWLDVITIFFVVLGCGYIVIRAGELVYAWGDANIFEMVLGTALILALMEASRRTSRDCLAYHNSIFLSLYDV